MKEYTLVVYQIQMGTSLTSTLHTTEHFQVRTSLYFKHHYITLYTFYFFINIFTNLGIPNIYYSRFNFQCKKSEEAFGVIEIRTRYSPPTSVIWKRNGALVHEHPHMEGDVYEMTQILTNRRYSYYTTYLRIRNVAHLIGSPIYTSIVENNGGSTSKNISTKHIQGISLVKLFKR